MNIVHFKSSNIEQSFINSNSALFITKFQTVHWLKQKCKQCTDLNKSANSALSLTKCQTVHYKQYINTPKSVVRMNHLVSRFSSHQKEIKENKRFVLLFRV